MDLRHPFHIFPIHLYHATKPPVVANDSESEAKLRAEGYSEDYVPQEFPKYVHAEVADEAAQVAAAKDGFAFQGSPEEPYPHIVSKLVQAPEVEKAKDVADAQAKVKADKEAEIRSAEAKSRAEARAARLPE